MFIVYSKRTGDIKNIATGDCYTTLKDLFPYDYLDYEIIYNCLILEDDFYVMNNFNFFKIENNKLVLKEEQFYKYRQ